jgi:hypothetical protein
MERHYEDLGMLRIVQVAAEDKRAKVVVELVDLIEVDLLSK